MSVDHERKVIHNWRKCHGTWAVRGSKGRSQELILSVCLCQLPPPGIVCAKLAVRNGQDRSSLGHLCDMIGLQWSSEGLLSFGGFQESTCIIFIVKDRSCTFSLATHTFLHLVSNTLQFILILFHSFLTIYVLAGRSLMGKLETLLNLKGKMRSPRNWAVLVIIEIRTVC